MIHDDRGTQIPIEIAPRRTQPVRETDRAESYRDLQRPEAAGRYCRRLRRAPGHDNLPAKPLKCHTRDCRARVGAKLCPQLLIGPFFDRCSKPFLCSRARQSELCSQAPYRSSPKSKRSAVKASETDHNRQAEAGSRLRLIEPASSPGHLLALLGREPGTVVVDNDVHRGALIPCTGSLREALNRDPRLGPFAGVIDQIADHFFEVLLLSPKAGALRGVDLDRNIPVVVDLLHGARQRADDSAHIGDCTYYA